MAAQKSVYPFTSVTQTNMGYNSGSAYSRGGVTGTPTGTYTVYPGSVWAGGANNADIGLLYWNKASGTFESTFYFPTIRGREYTNVDMAGTGYPDRFWLLWMSGVNGAPYEKMITSINNKSHYVTKYADGSISGGLAKFSRLYGGATQTRMGVHGISQSGDLSILSMDYNLAIKDQISFNNTIIDTGIASILINGSTNDVWLMLTDKVDTTSYYIVKWDKDDNNIATNGGGTNSGGTSNADSSTIKITGLTTSGNVIYNYLNNIKGEIYFSTSKEIIKLPADLSKIQAGNYGNYVITKGAAINNLLNTALTTSSDISISSVTPTWGSNYGSVASGSSSSSDYTFTVESNNVISIN